MHRSASIAKSLATLGCWGFEGPAMEIATPPHDHIPRGGVVRLLEIGGRNRGLAARSGSRVTTTDGLPEVACDCTEPKDQPVVTGHGLTGGNLMRVVVLATVLLASSSLYPSFAQ